MQQGCLTQKEVCCDGGYVSSRAAYLLKIVVGLVWQLELRKAWELGTALHTHHDSMVSSH